MTIKFILKKYDIVMFAKTGLFVFFIMLGLMSMSTPLQARDITILALGDSLTAGYLLPDDMSFPSQLEAALRTKHYAVRVVNAGVSGDTAADGLARLDWSWPTPCDIVIVELGANDMLRGQNPDGTIKVLGEILQKSQARGAKILLAGMKAAPSLGEDYQRKFDAIYPSLAHDFAVPLYPFFMEGVSGHPNKLLSDGLHPNAEGVRLIVAGILPQVEDLLHERMRVLP